MMRVSWSRTTRGVMASVALSGVLFVQDAAVQAGNLAAVATTMTPIYMNTAIGLNMIDIARRSTERVYGSKSKASEQRRASAAPVVSANFDVGADPAISRRTSEQFAEIIRANNDPSLAASIMSTFDRKPVRNAYLEAARPYGLGDHDLRDVTTAYLVTGWMVANKADPPTPDQVRAVRRQLGRATQVDAPTGSAGERQLAAEQMMYELVSLIYARQEGIQTRNQPAVDAMATATAESFRKRGFDPRDIRLTDQGFVHK